VWEVVGVVRSLAVAVCLVVVVLVVVLVVGPPASSTAAAAAAAAAAAPAVDPRAGGVLVGAHGVALLARLTGHPHQICPKTQQTNASINPFPLGDEHVTDRSNYPLIKYQRSFGKKTPL
jgi:broad specificity phosphatase PhoE